MPRTEVVMTMSTQYAVFSDLFSVLTCVARNNDAQGESSKHWSCTDLVSQLTESTTTSNMTNTIPTREQGLEYSPLQLRLSFCSANKRLFFAKTKIWAYWDQKATLLSPLAAREQYVVMLSEGRGSKLVREAREGISNPRILSVSRQLFATTLVYGTSYAIASKMRDEANGRLPHESPFKWESTTPLIVKIAAQRPFLCMSYYDSHRLRIRNEIGEQRKQIICILRIMKSAVQ